MKCITEDALRCELRATEPECYVIPEGKILTPAAREYLQSRKIKIVKAGQQEKTRIVATEVPPMPEVTMAAPTSAPAPQPQAVKPKFVDYETGAFYMEKPEHMTHLVGNVLVVKNHPRILFRGKLDSLQSLFVLAQVEIHEHGGSQALIDDLDDVLNILREMMRCDVLDEPFTMEKMIGLTHAELREQSHDPKRFFGVKAMVLPDYTMGKDFALLNQLRTAVRETEVAAAEAFHDGAKYTRGDIIEELNRMSTAMHIMMCRYLAGQYQN